MANEESFKHNTPGAAAFACAGPVLDNKCVMTNLSWVIDGQSLTIKYGIRYYSQELNHCQYLYWRDTLQIPACCSCWMHTGT